MNNSLTTTNKQNQFLTQTWLRTNFTERQNDEKDNNFIDIRLKKNWFGLFFNFSGLTTRKKCQSTETFHWLTDWQRTRQTFCDFWDFTFFIDTGLKWTQTKIWTITYIDYLTDTRPTIMGYIKYKFFFQNFCRNSKNWNVIKFFHRMS